MPKHKEGLMDQMTGARQSPRYPCNLNSVGGSVHPTFNSGGGRGAAEAASTHQTKSGVNPQRVLHVGSWNILTSRSLTVDWLGPRCYGLTQHEYLALSVPVQTGKDLNLQIAGDPCLTVWL